MRFFIYGNSGGIDKVKEELSNPKETFGGIKEVLVALKERYYNMFDIYDLSVIYYAYDERIEKDVYMVVTNKMGDENYIEEYGHPQFVSYLVTI